MALLAAIPSLLVGLVVYWLGRPKRLALLIGLVVFLVTLALLIIWSLPGSIESGETFFEVVP